MRLVKGYASRRRSGLTLAVGSSAIAAAQTVQQMKQLGGQTKDKRTQALAAATTALAVANAASTGLNVSASLTYGSSESHSDSTQTSSQTSGSTVKAGGNLNLVATAGKGEEGSGNITIQGSDINAGNNISLNADNTINLLADKSTASQVSHSTSSSSGVGVGASFGTNGAAIGVTANAAASRGNADGNDVTYTNTHLSAGNQLSIKSGGDTNLKGAVANGKQIIADIGGNLNIESLQDTSVYASANTSMSGSVTAGIGFSASGNYSQSNINGNYASVQEQSGLKSGDGGFQIAVKGNTDLKGAVIESSRAAIDAGNNSLITASLTSSDIQNRSEYDAQSLGVGGGFSVGGSDTGKSGQSDPASTGNSVRMQSFNDSANASLPIVMSAGENTASTTRSGISGASITITDEAKQKQLTGKDSSETIASLNRDVTTGQDTSGTIGNNLDVNEVQTSMAVTQAFVQQAGTFVANQAQKSDNLKAAGDAKKAEADKEPDPARKQQLLADAQNLYQQSADTKDESAKWGASGTYGRIATALTAAAGGNVTSSTTQLVQGAAVNYIQSLGAEQVKHIADTLLDDNGKETTASTAVRAALHAIVACTGANAQGSDCGSAALGASAGSLINSIMGGDPSTMTAKEKENRTNLIATLVTGIAATTDASNIAAATSAAQIETENNYLNPNELTAFKVKMKILTLTGDMTAQKVVIDEAKDKSIANDKALLSSCADTNSEGCKTAMKDSIGYGGDRSVDSVGMKDDRLRSIGVNFAEAYSLPDNTGSKFYDDRSSKHDFYTSMQDYATSQGSQVVWPQVAADITSWSQLGAHNVIAAVTGSPMLDFSHNAATAVFNTAFTELGKSVYAQAPLMGQAAYNFDRGLVVKEQKATQPLWDNVSLPDSSWMGVGAFKKGFYSSPGSPSLGNLQDRINFGNTLVDENRAKLGLPALSPLPTIHAVGKP